MNATAFLKQAMQHPAHTGALAPSSKRLSQAMVENAAINQVDTVVELGPGTGAITREILAAKDHATRYLGIERNPHFVTLLKKSFPGSNIVCGDAADLGEHLQHNRCDRVLSGLPWASFPLAVQSQLLEVIASSLSDTGLFLTFAYHPFNHFPRGRSFGRQLRHHFAEVKRTEMIRNFPPASIYICSTK